MKNPFAQSPAYWQASFTCAPNVAALAELYFDDVALSVSTFEADEKGMRWQVDVLYEAPPDEDDVKRRLQLLANGTQSELPDYTVYEVERQDWLLSVAQSFAPMRIGRFYVHGSHVANVPLGYMPLKVDAGLAFGSGEHATTALCLKALGELAKLRRISTILDVGTGSGILAMGAARLYPNAAILATDIDAVAVRVARENIRDNRLHRHIQCLVSDGYAARELKTHAPYELIMANILARPLMKQAKDLAASLAPGGVAILSGLLETQIRMVLQAHAAQGLRLQRAHVQNGWAALVLVA